MVFSLAEQCCEEQGVVVRVSVCCTSVRARVLGGGKKDPELKSVF